ncbi:winged helix-turn-helix transcriptional regulator [Allostreptomyces psammosilenae]|uniref:DNA-binding HxlR family transcriptional regulator/peroxiredoxin n=1 Tax=Allostreptomyces psammosilenae TaxID=1892865 RepID=A0A853A115_9ACTN|nr:winged helix-turn-helix transcriptional regulator [Allostreptomyces psammosilenae]NYI08313.1 DNA-binding HxlR family transcriptional regulator/peroxiredoxin [Allostreptomyces psammosilenae]
MTRRRIADDTCGIAQAAAVLGDWWSLLVVREIARGHRRFDELAAELAISRKVLTERLRHLTEAGVLFRRPYQTGPVRHEYLLTDRGRAFLPALVAMQDWADQWLLGDGALTATTEPSSAEAARVHALVGEGVPADLALPGADGAPHDVVSPTARATVLFTYPGTGIPSPLPAGWSDIPGAVGCTLENRLFRDAWPAFREADVAVRGVSTQRPDEQAAFAAAEAVPFPLLSDQDLRLAAALRLPTFRADQRLRLKRLVLVIGPDRTVRHARYPVVDIPGAVEEALRLAGAPC